MLDTVFGHAQNKEERLEWQEHLEPAVFSKKKKNSTESKEHTEDRRDMLNLKVSTSLSRYPTESWGGRFGVWAWLASHLKILFAYWKTAQPLRTAISPPWFGRSESRTALSAGQGRAALGRQHWDLWLSIAGSPVPQHFSVSVFAPDMECPWWVQQSWG